MKAMRRMFVCSMFIVLAINGCKPIYPHAVIEQEVKVDGYLKCEYRVETRLWVKDIFGSAVTLEEYLCEFNVPKDMVCEVKKKQYASVLPKYFEIKKFIKSGTDPCAD
jgi:hypothetical protein